MICNSCNKTIPDNSTFCQHCGNRISKPSSTKRSTEWEYKDFIYEFGEKNWRQNYTDSEARQAFWEYHQSWILSQLQEWRDKGWQPISEVGPAGISLRKKKVYDLDFIDWIFAVVTLGLTAFMSGKATRIFPVEFRVKMRRPK